MTLLRCVVRRMLLSAGLSVGAVDGSTSNCPELPQTGRPWLVQGSKESVLESKVESSEAMKRCFHCVLLARSLEPARNHGKGTQIPPLYGQSVKELTGKF